MAYVSKRCDFSKAGGLQDKEEGVLASTRLYNERKRRDHIGHL